MAYCRFSDGDIYLYQSIGGGIFCDMCPLQPPLTSADAAANVFATYDETIAHVQKHIAAGHHVPDGVIEELERDRDNGVSLEAETE